MEFKIHHCGLICRDYDEAIDFFVNRLGMELLRESVSKRRGGMKLEIGVHGTYLFEVFTVPASEPLEDPDHAAWHNHIAFGAKNVAETLAWLRLRGIETSDCLYDALAERDYGFFYGPDRLKFEVYQEKD